MVFNSISFSIRFAPPRVALAFEQRHVRFVKIPITCLVVIILLHYVSGKCCVPRYYYSIIIVPARTHGYRYMSDERRRYYRSINDYHGGRNEPSGQVQIVPPLSSRGRGHAAWKPNFIGRRSEYRGADFSASRFIVAVTERKKWKTDLIVIKFNYFIRGSDSYNTHDNNNIIASSYNSAVYLSIIISLRYWLPAAAVPER